MCQQSTICAVATSTGNGAIAVIRISGNDAFTVTEKIFHPANKKKKLSEQKANTIHFGTIKENDEIIDEVLVSVFKAPHSYTGENSVEISCHGSAFIQQKILNLLTKNGAIIAEPGEYTQRSFLNGKMDLSQAEAVADLIASESAAAHRIAVQQLRGGFSDELQSLRQQLLQFISLVELELDFSEEDVEFADRTQLQDLISKIHKHIIHLANSFELGNALKKGIPVAIIGEPNVGKSTLLNALLKDDKAIVSDIAGTTRDAIEDVITIDGILFRFIDTAGLRETDDKIEKLGIERTNRVIDKAEIIILVTEPEATGTFWEETIIKVLEKKKKLIVVINKIDVQQMIFSGGFAQHFKTVKISAKTHKNIDELLSVLVKESGLNNYTSHSDTIITNVRHYEALSKADKACQRVQTGLDMNTPGDLLAQDIKDIMTHIGSITGTFSSDEVLENIFSHFCIGK